VCIYESVMSELRNVRESKVVTTSWTAIKP